jgi:hypothetical protein
LPRRAPLRRRRFAVPVAPADELHHAVHVARAGKRDGIVEPAVGGEIASPRCFARSLAETAVTRIGRPQRCARAVSWRPKMLTTDAPTVPRPANADPKSFCHGRPKGTLQSPLLRARCRAVHGGAPAVS